MITRTIIGVWFTGCLSGIVGGVNVEQLHKTVGRHIGIVGTYRAESTFRAKQIRLHRGVSKYLGTNSVDCVDIVQVLAKILAMFLHEITEHSRKSRPDVHVSNRRAYRFLFCLDCQQLIEVITELRLDWEVTRHPTLAFVSMTEDHA
jgi:hypothetical protein